MYDESMRLYLFGFDSGVFGSGDIDEIVVNGGGMDIDVDGSNGKMDANVEVFEVTQQLAKVLLTFFVWGIVCVWEECGLDVFFIVQC